MTMLATIADTGLRDAVMRELTWDPQVDASMIGVTATEGIVTLSGYIDTYAARLAAERAARRVYGVKAVANELAVKLAETRIDPEIAEAAVQTLANRIDAPRGITVTVRDGHITLGGTVEWMYQRAAAERAVKISARRPRCFQQHRRQTDRVTARGADTRRAGTAPLRRHRRAADPCRRRRRQGDPDGIRPIVGGERSGRASCVDRTWRVGRR